MSVFSDKTVAVISRVVMGNSLRNINFSSEIEFLTQVGRYMDRFIRQMHRFFFFFFGM